MKYQALKSLKTKTKLLKMCDTLQEAHDVITKQEGATFNCFSYVGGFPLYMKYTTNNKNPIFYSIQGQFFLDNGEHIVCSIDEKEKSQMNFNE